MCEPGLIRQCDKHTNQFRFATVEKMTIFKQLSIYWITGRIDFKVPTILPMTISSFLLEFKVSGTKIESLK